MIDYCIFVQARMSSSRTPGKVLKEISGKPMLLRQLERLKNSNENIPIICVTSIDKKDDAIEQLCNKYNFDCFRGSLDNVLDRYISASDGYYEFLTIQPGPYPYPNRGIEWRPMHIHFSIFGKSFGQRLITQMYFEGDPLIKLCPMVNSIPDEKAINSLIGLLDTSKSSSHNILAYKFDIILRGANQTYFENEKEGL